MSQAGYWEQKLKELSTWQADVRLTHNARITIALEQLSKALTNAMPDDLQGDVRVAADTAMDNVKLKASQLATKLTVVDTTVDLANTTRRTMAQNGMNTLDSYPAKMEWWQEAAVRGAVAGATITFGPLSWIASDYAADSINNYLANAREAEAQRQVKSISDAMDAVTFDSSREKRQDEDDSRLPNTPGAPPNQSSYDSIPGAGYNPMNNSFNGQLAQQPQIGIGGPIDNNNTLPPVGPPHPPIDLPPTDPPTVISHGPWPKDPWDPTNPPVPPFTTFDPTNPPIGWTPDDPTGSGSTTWPRPTGPVGSFGPGTGFGGAGGIGGGGGAALVGGAGGGVALGGAKLMAGTRTGAGLAGNLGGSTGMMGGTGTAGGAAGRGGAAAASAGRSGGMMGSSGAAGGASNGSGTKGGAGRSGSGMMGGSGQGGSSDNKKRRNGMGGIVAPSLDGDDEVGARSRAAEAGGRARIEDLGE